MEIQGSEAMLWSGGPNPTKDLLKIYLQISISK